jgi:4'-phosphopantetheinyl transferase
VRRDHALRFRQEHDRRLSLAAYRLLQRALRVEYGIIEPPVFTYDAHGKPSLAEHPHIFFNMSHCHEAAACVVGSAPVGIDVESLDHYDEELMKMVMNAEEQQQISASPDPRIAFIRLWTMKESLLKMTGEGLSSDLRNVLKNSPDIKNDACYFHTTVYPQFVCTVCYSKN